MIKTIVLVAKIRNEASPETMVAFIVDWYIIFVKFNIASYSWVEKEADDLTPATKENVTIDELMQTWMAKLDGECLFISATKRTNIEELRSVLYDRVKQLHVQKYPYNDFLYPDTEYEQ